MKLFISQTLILLQLATGLKAASYQLVIAPESAAGVEGNSSLDAFGHGELMRFQQVYSSSTFLAFPFGGNIAEVDFRADALNGHNFDLTVSDVEIHLSTTSKPVDGLSPVFNENVGPDDRVVRSREPFGVGGGSGGGRIGVWSEFVSIFANPFFYNPTEGNLLLDIRMFGTNRPAIGALDAVNTAGDSVSSVYASSLLTPAGTGDPNTLGLATLFAIQPIPEPGTLTLGLLAVGLAVLVRSKRVVNRRRKHGTH